MHQRLKINDFIQYRARDAGENIKAVRNLNSTSL
jgi:hypothetical protein